MRFSNTLLITDCSCLFSVVWSFLRERDLVMDFLLAHFKLKKAQTNGRPVVYLILYVLHTCVRNNYFLRLLFNSKRNETVIWMCESVFAYIKRHFHRALTCSLSSSPKNIHNNQNTRHTHTHTKIKQIHSKNEKHCFLMLASFFPLFLFFRRTLQNVVSFISIGRFIMFVCYFCFQLFFPLVFLVYLDDFKFVDR